MNESVQVRNAPGRWAPVYRSRAAEDLLSRIPNRAPRRIAEVFGGQGPMTALLARRFPGAEIEAFDLSRCDDNLAATLPDRFHTQVLGGRALNVKIKFEVVFSNGSLEMLPALRRLLPILVAMLAGGGWLAVQIPNDLYEPSRALMRMVAADGPWAKTLLPIAKSRPFDESMEGLYALLSPICATVDIWESTYLCVMTGGEAVVEWMKATRTRALPGPARSNRSAGVSQSLRRRAWTSLSCATRRHDL